MVFCERKVEIFVNGNSLGTFVCNKCRSNEQCDSGKNCLLHNYVAQRVTNTQFKLNNQKSELSIKTDDFEKTMTVLKRAIKLRHNKLYTR